MKFFLIEWPSGGIPNRIKTKMLTICFYFIQSFFWKRKKSLELASLPHFLHKFWRIIFCKLCSINWFNFIAWLSLLLQKLDNNICIVIICCPDCDAMYFGITLNLLIQPFFYIIKKSRQKYKYLKNKKDLRIKANQI